MKFKCDMFECKSEATIELVDLRSTYNSYARNLDTIRVCDDHSLLGVNTIINKRIEKELHAESET